MKDLCNLGKVAFITGAGDSKIGRAIALKVAELGTTMIVTDMKKEAAQATVDLLPTFEGQRPHEALALDVTNREQVFEVLAYVKENYGTLDFLFNNAGVSTMQWIENLTVEEYDFNFDVNMKGMFHVTQAALPLMKEKGGKMINTASVGGFKPAPLLAHYIASKFAVVGFSKTAAMEFGKYGISVNCLCPGYVQTAMQARELVWEAELRGMTPEAVSQEFIDMTPLGRLVQPEDVGDVASFLASPQSNFMNGQCLVISGGSDLV